jgi:hypothetical protein
MIAEVCCNNLKTELFSSKADLGKYVKSNYQNIDIGEFDSGI